MKTAYLGKIQLSDVDLSYLHEAQKQSDVTYILEINPRFMKGPALSLEHICRKNGVFKATDIYPELASVSGFIDTEKFYIVNTSGRLWFAKAFLTNILLLVFLIRNRFDVIHLAWPPHVYEFILYVLRQKMILTVHDPFPHTGLDTFIVRLRRKAAFRMIRRLVILNRRQRDDFRQFYGIDDSRIIESRLSSYTYLNTIEGRMPAQGAGQDYILFAGKISRYKGLDYLLPAMEQVHRLHPAVKLLVCGKGDFHFDVSRYENLDYIEIHNRFIPDNELVGLIQGSLFMVCPYTDATQSGVVMSAFAFAKPVIATNVGGLPEMVEDGKLGLVIKEKDTDALADAMARLLDDRHLIQAFSDNIRNSYNEGDSSWKHIAVSMKNEYVNLYGTYQKHKKK